MKQVLSVLMIIVLLHTSALAGLGSKKAEYVGGTWTQFKQGQEGHFNTDDAKIARFTPDDKKLPSAEIPYDRVTSIEFGQKVGRRVGATIGWGVTTLGVMALPMLLSKKRKHYVTIGYTDTAGANQGIVLELGKNVTRGTLAALEARTGKKVEYESDEAREYAGN